MVGKILRRQLVAEDESKAGKSPAEKQKQAA
jgi:hypothetical protein